MVCGGDCLLVVDRDSKSQPERASRQNQHRDKAKGWGDTMREVTVVFSHGKNRFHQGGGWQGVTYLGYGHCQRDTALLDRNRHGVARHSTARNRQPALARSYSNGKLAVELVT